jgi:predicted HTH domain antitoxin
MAQMEDILTNFEKYIETLVTISAILAGAVGTITYQWRNNMQTNKVLEEIKQSSDEKQDAKIETLTTEVESLKKVVELLGRQLKQLSEALFIHNEAEKKHDFIGNLKREIMLETHNILENIKDVDDAYQSLSIEGAKAAYEWLKNIYYAGYANFSPQQARREAFSALRGLRSQHVGNSNISHDVSNAIRDKIAESILFDFVSGMNRVKAGDHNGNSDIQFKRLALALVGQFISRGWAVYCEHKKSQA